MTYLELCEALQDCWGTGCSVGRMNTRHQMMDYELGKDLPDWESRELHEILVSGNLDAPDYCVRGSLTANTAGITYLRS